MVEIAKINRYNANYYFFGALAVRGIDFVSLQLSGADQGREGDSLPYFDRDTARPATPPKSSAPRTILYLERRGTLVSISCGWIELYELTLHRVNPEYDHHE